MDYVNPDPPDEDFLAELVEGQPEKMGVRSNNGKPYPKQPYSKPYLDGSYMPYWLPSGWVSHVEIHLRSHR